MPHDVITIGSATVDVFMKSAQFHLQPTREGLLLCQEYGGKLDVDDFEVQSGGAGTNTAVGFARAGFRTAAVVEIGKDIFAQMVWDDLKRDEVDTEFVVSEKGEKTAVSTLLISGDGGRSAMTFRGAASMLEPRDIPWNALRDTRWIHISNLGGDPNLLSQLFDAFRRSSVGVSWNPGSKELQKLASGQLRVDVVEVDILFVNREEWEVVKPVQRELLQRIPQIIVTDGRNGGDVYFRGQYQVHYTIQVVPVVQETGAGDAFVVGYVSAHLLNKPIGVCCDWGVRSAASVVQHLGAKTGLLQRDELEQHDTKGK